MAILSFIDQSGKCIFKLKSSEYMKWDVRTKTKKLKPYYKRVKVICHCCKEGREMVISSTKNQDGKRSYYLKRKPKTEEHHPSCPFCKEREVRGETGEDDMIRHILESLIADSMEYAINTKRKKGMEATSDDLMVFIKAKLNKLKANPQEGYRLLADSYLEIPTFQAYEDKRCFLELHYGEKQINPFVIGKIEKVEDKKDRCVLHVNTNRRNLIFKYSVPKSNLSENDLESLLNKISGEEIWITGIFTKESKSNFIALKKIVFFYLTHSGTFLSKKMIKK